MSTMISKSLEETGHIADNFIQQVLNDKVGSGALVVALSGDLGSGKTTFTQAVARELGIEENVTSPTFVIEKIYRIDTPRFKRFIHIDAYRIEKSSEMKALGFDEVLTDPENLVFIEWAEKIIDVLPKEYIQAKFTFVDEHTREVEFIYI